MITMTPNLRSIVDHDGAVILDISNNAMTTLNSTGAYIWQRLQLGLLPNEIAAELAHATGTEEGLVAIDVDEFMAQLKSKKLVAVD
jgi:hypothetical protein